jgi:hypothetical protein
MARTDGLKPPFEKGVSGNPGGKPEGARNRLTKRFLNALCDDFEKGGAKAIKECRENDPAAYLKVCAALVPKEMTLEVKHSFVDALRELERIRREAAAVGTGVAEVGERPAAVRH